MIPGEIIKKHLIDKGIKYSFIAKKTGMSKDAISKSLAGKRKFKGLELMLICRELGLDISDFSSDE